MTRIIPAVRYHKPDGRRQKGGFPVPAAWEEESAWRQIQDKLDLLEKHHIEITAELIGNQVNVCLDDGEMNYKFELFENNPDIARKVIDLVIRFDEQDYLRAKAAIS